MRLSRSFISWHPVEARGSDGNSVTTPPTRVAKPDADVPKVPDDKGFITVTQPVFEDKPGPQNSFFEGKYAVMKSGKRGVFGHSKTSEELR